MIDIDQLKKHLLAGTRMDPECIPEDGPVLLPKDFTLADLEPYAKAPTRHRGTFRTTWPDEFIAYAEANAEPAESPHCFLSDATNPPTAEILFDFGDHTAPLWREHRALLTVQESDAFMAFQALAGRNLTQDDITSYIDDWANNLSFERPDGALVAPAVARTEFADLTVEQVKQLRSKQQDFSRERSAVERMSMGTGLPNRLHLTCEPWQGLGVKRLTARISAADSAGALALKLTLIGWPTIRRELIDELGERLSSVPVTVRRGTFLPGLRPASA